MSDLRKCVKSRESTLQGNQEGSSEQETLELGVQDAGCGEGIREVNVCSGSTCVRALGWETCQGESWPPIFMFPGGDVSSRESNLVLLSPCFSLALPEGKAETQVVCEFKSVTLLNSLLFSHQTPKGVQA